MDLATGHPVDLHDYIIYTCSIYYPAESTTVFGRILWYTVGEFEYRTASVTFLAVYAIRYWCFGVCREKSVL